MDETKKTGIFWAVGLITLMVGMFVAWPTKTKDDEGATGRLLFEKFSDPLTASNMKVVTFNEEQGELDEFVVRKNADTELWTIESKADYPADAVEQVKKSANALIGLKILDTQTTNAEDHAKLGVVEPDLQKLQVGDEGVGRLVTFKDKGRETLASIIIGDALKDDPEKRYVRVPGQDPVYVVRFDPSSVTTEFQDWIEEDLLQLSSIEISEVTIDDYSASIGGNGRFSMDRNYVAKVKQEGTAWELVSLAEYDESSIEPTEVEVGDDQSLATQKLNDLKNALDDLKFVNVYRKPPGMSASLRANADLLKDNESLSSLLGRGFYPVAMQADDENREVEIVAANGELRVSTTGGVQYALRFGNVNSVDQNSSGGEDDTEGVNRYLLVTTSVDESQFPVPELAAVPDSVEEIKQRRMAEKAAENAAAPEAATEEPAAAEETADDSDPEMETADSAAEQSEAAAEEPAEDQPATEDSEPAAEDEPAEMNEEGADSSEEAGSTEELAGEEDSTEKPESEKADTKTESDGEESAGDAEDQAGDSGSGQAEDSGSGQAEGSGSGQDEDSAEAAEAEAEESDDGEDTSELTEEEWQELLEAEQEMVTKSNQRLMDERKDKMAAAEKKVRELNARFADWYYVIPESTYNKLRIKQSELFESPEGSDAAATDAQPPRINVPGLPQVGP